ncbi:uncharacterized protein LOC130732926 isoform X3 [Lotus japonicus]|uniref:uncharacterized protein LOC130732926 isoform X3 n=1 Tax=Lotus japonicus TaxID=34305 RepID=UPI00258378EF|nr:uncharacterized protein LOC130732926 isoform X3 [Lotus japonicus]
MMDWLSCFASAFGKDLVCGAVDELCYPCCFNNFVEDLQHKENKLITTINSVDDRAKHAKKQAMKTAEVLDKWLEEANPLKEEVEGLLKEARTSKSSKCLCYCPNWLWRYRLGKKLANKKDDIEKCNDEGRKYIQLERVATLTSMPSFSGDKYLKFNSRKLAYQQLMEAVENDEVSMIGLYGMGGCGKTTLAMELMNTKQHMFDKVLFVTISNSNTLDIRTIQDKIASPLQYTFPENGEMERAQRLRTRLIQENKILLILDDVWQFLDFDTIGIPTSTTHKGCKVLITTRLEAVCTSMDCQRKISLSILKNDEAWVLFRKQACLSEVTSDTLKRLARLISDECKGLPVAIAAVASTLKGKSEVEWKVALDSLRNSKPVNVEKGLQNPYKCLQLSYDNLDTEEAKALFLLSSVYPEDYEISVEQLTRCAIGLGLGGEIHSYEGARNEVSATINKLISSCLLLDGQDHVKMHDLVRDVAHWIANDHYSPRYLWTENVPYELDFSNLEYLWLRTELEISGEIYKRMRKLRVLLLLNPTGRNPLSTMAFKSLTKLRYLFLSWWELSDFSFLGDMKELETLELFGCSFIELPNDVEVTQLKNLRLLALAECRIKKNNFEAIARLQLLEELYVGDWSSTWDHYNENVAELFNKCSVVQGLKRYVIQGNDIPYPIFEFEPLRYIPYQKILVLGYFHTSYAAAKVLAERAEYLTLKQIEGGAKNFMPDIIQLGGGGGGGGGSMNELKYVKIRNSKEIKYLIDTSNHLSEVGNLFPELLVLKIYDMDHLITLCHGHLPSSDPFQKLEELHLINCPEVTYLFTTVVARSLAELKTLWIEECHGLKHILVEDDTEDISPYDNSLVFSKLEFLRVYKCGKIEYIIPVTVAQGLVQLETLHILKNDALKYVFGRNSLGPQSGNELDIEIPALNFLWLEDLPQAISIFPDNCYPRLPSLQKFCLISCPEFATKSIRTCRKIENWYDHEEKKDLENLPQLTYICMSFKDPSKFKKLAFLNITGCEKVDVIFHARVSRCLCELKILVIRECKELKQIVEEEVENDKLSNLPSQQPQPCFPKLELLFVEECHKLKRFISFSRCNDLPNLVALIISRASKLEELIGCEQGNGGYEIGEKKVELPKLKYVMFRQLPKLCQLIESQIVRHCTVINCPKLSLTSTATFQEFKEEILKDDVSQISGIESWELRDIINSVIRGENSIEQAQAASGSELASSQINEESKKEFIEEVSSSEKKDPMPKTSSTLGKTVSEDNQIQSESTAPESSKFVESEKRKQSDTTLKIVEAEIAPISSPNLIDSIEETKRANTGKDPALDKPAIPSSGSELRGPSPTSLTTPLHKVPLHKLVDQEQTSLQGVLEKQVTLGETISIEDIGKETVQEGNASNETRMKTLSTGVEGIGEGSNMMNKEGACTNFAGMDDAQVAINNAQLKSCPYSGINLRQTETDIDIESADHPINIDDLCVSELASEHSSTKDNLVAKTVVDLEESLNMPLKDIARSEANCIRLLTALKFLSHLSLKDAALPDGLKTIIDSMHKELPSILCSFKQAFVTIEKFAVIGAHQNEAANNLVSKISKVKDFLDEAQQKEAVLKGEIIRLKKEMNDREADLSSLQEEKKKCIQESIGYKRDFGNVSKDISQMVEDQRKARQELFAVDYKWSALCSQFHHNRIVNRNHS